MVALPETDDAGRAILPDVADSIDALFSHPTPSTSSRAASSTTGTDAAGGGADEEEAKANAPKPDSPWLGIDLGTSNCSCAAWSSEGGEAVTLPLKRFGLGRPDGGDGGGRRIVPSAALLRWRKATLGDGDRKCGASGWEDVGDILGVPGLEALVGHAALEYTAAEESSNDAASTSTLFYSASDMAGATVTSVKRILGLAEAEARIAVATEGGDSEGEGGGGGFLESLPFEARLLAGGGKGGDLEEEKAASATGEGEVGGFEIVVRPLRPRGGDNDRDDAVVVALSPLRLAALLLRSIRRAAQSALSTGKYAAPGLLAPAASAEGKDAKQAEQAKEEVEIHNVILGVPAHFSLPRRRAVVAAARLAGFKGYVGTVTESTAAALAYGLFVSPDKQVAESGAGQQDAPGNDDDERRDIGGEGMTRDDGEKDAAEEASGAEATTGGAADGGIDDDGEDDEGWTAVSKPSLPSSDDDNDGAERDSAAAANAKNDAKGGAPPPAAESSDAKDEVSPPRGHKAILVFDMGGGTTDVTIASMGSSSSSGGEEEEDVRFRVLATAGDDRLGGDDLDDALARYVLESKLNDVLPGSEATALKSRRRQLRPLCRAAKEKLCGNVGGEDGDDDVEPQPSAEFEFMGVTVAITREEFESAIEPLVKRAEGVVREALRAFSARVVVGVGVEATPLPVMDEVVLVGGSSRAPPIRSMLAELFPPPTPPELCTSIDPERAVGRGCAIRAAAASGLVPKWELRNALMLDALPHGLGVLVGGDKDGVGRRYISVLRKDMALPAMDHAVFKLADPSQAGITVVAAEDVHGHCDGTVTVDGDGDGDVSNNLATEPQVVQTFTFLLHRPTEAQLAALRREGRAREVLVGMTVGTDGSFVVSVFDELDPEHAEKRRRYLAKKGGEAGDEGDDADRPVAAAGTEAEEGDGEASSSSTTTEELLLMGACAVVVVAYVAARVAFSVPPDGEEGSRIL